MNPLFSVAWWEYYRTLLHSCSPAVTFLALAVLSPWLHTLVVCAGSTYRTGGIVHLVEMSDGSMGDILSAFYLASASRFREVGIHMGLPSGEVSSCPCEAVQILNRYMDIWECW